MILFGNAYDRRELAGAFGDLGILAIRWSVPDDQSPRSAGCAAGLWAVALVTGLFFRTPLSVQPMKAIGTAAMIGASAVVTGLLWLVMAETGLAD